MALYATLARRRQACQAHIGVSASQFVIHRAIGRSAMNHTALDDRRHGANAAALLSAALSAMRLSAQLLPVLPMIVDDDSSFHFQGAKTNDHVCEASRLCRVTMFARPVSIELFSRGQILLGGLATLLQPVCELQGLLQPVRLFNTGHSKFERREQSWL